MSRPADDFERKRQLQLRSIGYCSIGAIGTLAVVAAYQVGALVHLPDPSGKVFDSDRVVSSKESRVFGLPDALLGITSYATTLALAQAAARRPDSRPLYEAVGLKVWIDFIESVFKAAEQWPRHKALCSWCLGVTAASVGNLALFKASSWERSTSNGLSN